MSQENQIVAQAATNTDVLPMGELSLIGIFHGPGGYRALLRAPNGSVGLVRPGDRFASVRVAGIGDGVVAIERRGETVQLSMPGAEETAGAA